MLAWMCFKQTQRSFSQILLKMVEVSGLISCCQLSFTIRKALRPSAERSVRTLQRGYVLVMDIKLPCWANFLNECLQPPSVSIIMAAAPPPPVAVKAGTTHPEDGAGGGGGIHQQVRRHCQEFTGSSCRDSWDVWHHSAVRSEALGVYIPPSCKYGAAPLVCLQPQ